MAPGHLTHLTRRSRPARRRQAEDDGVSTSSIVADALRERLRRLAMQRYLLVADVARLALVLPSVRVIRI
jgi:hypothetical protein